MTEPLIRVKQLAYVRVEAPDIAKAEKFLEEFGLQLVERSNHKTYLRGTDAEAPCYILSQGTGTVTAIAFEADSFEDLQTISEMPEASQIESLDEPSGGQVVRLTDPMGMQVEIVYGREALQPLDAAPSHTFNMNGLRPRVGEFPAVSHGPSNVRRIGHLVLESADPEPLYGWYHERFGLTKSDAVLLPDGSPQMVFSRLDRGEDYVDHHVVGFQYALDEGTRVQHIAFEVGNLDDLMSGADTC
jgi:catechol 2,3-dioxygenase-like lactoylglutathione lyase family enzyme